MQQNATIEKIPLADGGEDTITVLSSVFQTIQINKQVSDPLGRKISAHYALTKDGKFAIIEMAKASGLMLVSESDRNILKSNTYGTGELIADALDRNVEEIILSIGGSSTNDAALGAASALGIIFLDESNLPIEAIPENFLKIKTIQTNAVHPKLYKTSIKAICDVDAFFFGDTGAAKLFAKQKGASISDVNFLEKAMMHIAELIEKQFNISLPTLAGSGAGGGFAGGAHALFRAQLQSGIQTVIKLTELEKKIMETDLVITGEGCIDKQSALGKVVSGVYALAVKHNKPIILIGGQVENGITDFPLANIVALQQIAPSITEAKKNTIYWLKEITKHLNLAEYDKKRVY
ncbi:MAG: glycerate kinase [Cyclobacteriaceae bacterium]|nr:glycerate kinase [Cyclobacteriaceae bacterium]